LAANKFEEIIGDALAIETAEGDSSVLMMKVAKERLAWAEKTSGFEPGRVEFVGFKDWMNPEYLQWLFRRREHLMLLQLQGIMDRDMKIGGFTLFETWQMRVSDQVQALAKAYIERVCLEQFLAEAKTNPKIGSVLERLAVLFAVDSVNTEIGWFLTNGVIALEQGAKLPDTLRELCGKGRYGIAPWAIHLVNAFSIPEHLLPPAARDWVQYNGSNNEGELLRFKY
jgi:hypothetical protein